MVSRVNHSSSSEVGGLIFIGGGAGTNPASESFSRVEPSTGCSSQIFSDHDDLLIQIQFIASAS